jgi:hypothetical protein
LSGWDDDQRYGKNAKNKKKTDFLKQTTYIQRLIHQRLKKGLRNLQPLPIIVLAKSETAAIIM